MRELQPSDVLTSDLVVGPKGLVHQLVVVVVAASVASGHRSSSAVVAGFGGVGCTELRQCH